MPNIIELMKDNKLGKGVKIEIPVMDRKVDLPRELTGCGYTQTLSTQCGDYTVTKCVCTSTGELTDQGQLICINKPLPIELELQGFTGTVNGHVAVDAACGALLSLKKQLVVARNITVRQFDAYEEMLLDERGYWLSDFSYQIQEAKPDENVRPTVCAGMCYVDHILSRKKAGIMSGMCEVLGEQKTHFAEKAVNKICPVFYLPTWNYALELEKNGENWLVTDVTE